ncbi:chaperonin 10-like protein [Ephemerocybe angulata]|uniref:Chaperonin 10-like protein n=1 Tax=Ephemerocybe angulata TaxID=980116 RepID=A0A8H6I1A0_9AGAR|nr:chaperonin 10-like protein [Tulosesus angulatus]
MAPTEQKALLLESKFGDFALSSFPVPKAKSGEVLVKIHASGLNPVDWKIQKYGLFLEDFPAILGADVAGEVIELGEGVSESQVAVGDRVFFQSPYNGNDYGGFQQYAAGEVATLAKIPSDLSYDDVATIPGAFTAAYIGLYNVAPLGFGFEAPVRAGARGKYAGTPIVILGGSTSVGHSRSSPGFSPIIATASPSHSEHLKALGATHVLDRKAPLTKESIKSITEIPINVVYDTVSVPDTQKVAFELVEAGGQIAITLPADSTLEERAPKENKSFASIMGSKLHPHNVELFREAWPHVTALLEEGALKRLEANAVSGFKLIAHPQETA